MSRSYAIIGTGAVGGFYGALLQQAGHEVHFLLHSDYEHVKKKGLVVESRERYLILGNVHAHRHASDVPPCDVAVVALKTTQNKALPGILPRVLKKDGVALVLQNGLGMEDEAARLVGPDRVMGGLCFICSYKEGPGYIHHLDYGDVILGEYGADGRARGITPRLKAIGADFEETRIPVQLSDDLLLARWKKLVWNIPYNALSVILDATTDRIMADPATAARVRRIMDEVVAIAAACGRRIDPEFVKKMLADTARMNPYRTSMKIDFDQKRPMEIEAIYGNPLRAARAAGCAAPEVEKLYEELKRLDAADRAVVRSPKSKVQGPKLARQSSPSDGGSKVKRPRSP